MNKKNQMNGFAKNSLALTRTATRGTNRAIAPSPDIFMHYFVFSKKG